jgi:hypothetical protein
MTRYLDPLPCKRIYLKSLYINFRIADVGSPPSRHCSLLLLLLQLELCAGQTLLNGSGFEEKRIDDGRVCAVLSLEVGCELSFSYIILFIFKSCTVLYRARKWNVIVFYL